MGNARERAVRSEPFEEGALHGEVGGQHVPPCTAYQVEGARVVARLKVRLDLREHYIIPTINIINV